MPSKDPLLDTQRWRKVRNQFRAHCSSTDAPCWLCHQPIDYTLTAPNPDAWEADHLYPRSTHPELTLDPAGLRPSHVKCNRARGNSLVTDELGAPSRTWIRGSS